MKKYESYEDPPDKPFFGKSRKKTLSTATRAVVSPGKRLSMQSECIDQLDKWHKLMECGGISPEEYNTILDVCFLVPQKHSQDAILLCSILPLALHLFYHTGLLCSSFVP